MHMLRVLSINHPVMTSVCGSSRCPSERFLLPKFSPNQTHHILIVSINFLRFLYGTRPWSTTDWLDKVNFGDLTNTSTWFGSNLAFEFDMISTFETCTCMQTMLYIMVYAGLSRLGDGPVWSGGHKVLLPDPDNAVGYDDVNLIQDVQPHLTPYIFLFLQDFRINITWQQLW